MYGVLSSVFVCLQSIHLTAATRHSVIITLFLLYMFGQLIFCLTNALSDAPFMMCINYHMIRQHGTALRELL